MMIRAFRSCACLLALTASTISGGVAAATIHEERSLYRNILVRDYVDRRCLLFSVRRSERNQSCIDLNNPDQLVFTYAHMMLAGLLFKSHPERILMVGLGGASLPRVFEQLFPEAHQDIVEIDAAVLQVAEKFFQFEPTDRMVVHIRDARVFVKRARDRGLRYDYIMLDAFNGEYIPEHLMTKEFLEEVRSLLNPGGVIIANTFSSSDLYDHESATYHAVFTHLAELRLPGSLNRILVAYEGPWPEENALLTQAQTLQPTITRYGVNAEDLAHKLDRSFEYDKTVRLLTDQYAPANLLSQ